MHWIHRKFYQKSFSKLSGKKGLLKMCRAKHIELFISFQCFGLTSMRLSQHPVNFLFFYTYCTVTCSALGLRSNSRFQTVYIIKSHREVYTVYINLGFQIQTPPCTRLSDSAGWSHQRRPCRSVPVLTASARSSVTQTEPQGSVSHSQPPYTHLPELHQFLCEHTYSISYTHIHIIHINKNTDKKENVVNVWSSRSYGTDIQHIIYTVRGSNNIRTILFQLFNIRTMYIYIYSALNDYWPPL